MFSICYSKLSNNQRVNPLKGGVQAQKSPDIPRHLFSSSALLGINWSGSKGCLFPVERPNFRFHENPLGGFNSRGWTWLMLNKKNGSKKWWSFWKNLGIKSVQRGDANGQQYKQYIVPRHGTDFQTMVPEFSSIQGWDACMAQLCYFARTRTWILQEESPGPDPTCLFQFLAGHIWTPSQMFQKHHGFVQKCDIDRQWYGNFDIGKAMINHQMLGGSHNIQTRPNWNFPR